MALPNARNQYLKTQIETATKEQLVVMLFDGIIRFTEQARKAMLEEKIEESHHALMRAQAIVMELICTIDKDKGGEVADNLMSLHAYAFNCLIVCNMKKDVSKIDEVQKIYRELRDAWVGAMDTLGIASNAAKPAAPSAPAAAGAQPAAAAPAKPVAIPAAPAKPAMGAPGIMAAAPQAPAAGLPSVPPAPAAAPKATGYGMGRTAMMGGLTAPAAAPAALQQPAPVPQQIATSAASAKQAAMLNAYGSGSRSIA